MSMDWSDEARKALSRVPFFVRKRVRSRVEEEARQAGAESVELAHVTACQQRFLKKMDVGVKGYRLEHCFGPSGCSNRAGESNQLIESLDRLLSGANVLDFLRANTAGEVKLHQEFRVSLSDCPNACSRPQIVDLGVIAARRPMVSREACSHCGECIETCREGVLSLGSKDEGPRLEESSCLGCGQCLQVCPSGTLQENERGFRVLLGGKLGRHPRLGSELPGLFSEEQVLAIAERSLELFTSQEGEVKRFGQLLDGRSLEDLFPPPETGSMGSWSEGS